VRVTTGFKAPAAPDGRGGVDVSFGTGVLVTVRLRRRGGCAPGAVRPAGWRSRYRRRHAAGAIRHSQQLLTPSARSGAPTRPSTRRRASRTRWHRWISSSTPPAATGAPVPRGPARWRATGLGGGGSAGDGLRPPSFRLVCSDVDAESPYVEIDHGATGAPRTPRSRPRGGVHHRLGRVEAGLAGRDVRHLHLTEVASTGRQQTPLL
jgi:hypothetical protein